MERELTSVNVVPGTNPASQMVMVISAAVAKRRDSP